MIDGRFQITGVLGKGGMGTVYLANDLSSNREVALKTVQEGGHDAARLERFRREGEITASLQHPNIVRVFSAGELQGLPYLAYELVEGGRPLDEVLSEVSLDARIELVRDVARALGFAHAQGVVHRDVKPDNLLVDADGRVKVADFGLATARGLERMTQTGAMLGTPTHMAPEQFEGHRDAIGPGVDVWALGVVLYRALTGARPFAGTNLMELMSQVIDGDVTPPRARESSVPAALEAVCLKALAPAPEQRYADGGALADDLERYLAGEPVLAQPQGPLRALLRRGRRGAAPIGLALAAAAAASLTYRAIPRPSRAPEPRVERPERAPPAKPQEPAIPAWFAQQRFRPKLPLPRGLTFGARPGEYVNAKDGSVLVWIPAGSFTMGGARNDQLPPHRVRLTRGFFLGKFEVTWKEYRAFALATKRPLPSGIRSLVAIPRADRFPVYSVTWEDAAAYCAWAGLRLPTEAEFEWAARGGEADTKFPWGDTEPSVDRCNTKSTRNPKFPTTTPVGHYARGVSPFGCFDLGGNVWEWLHDAYQPFYAAGPQIDPQGPTNTTGLRCRRGGSWFGSDKHTRARFRGEFRHDRSATDLGFRVARSP